MRRPALSAFSPAAPSTLTRTAVEVEYPSSDGKPLAENDAQHAAILYGVGCAGGCITPGAGDVYVSCDLLIYYEEGEPAGGRWRRTCSWCSGWRTGCG